LFVLCLRCAGAARLCGCVGKFRTIVAAVADFLFVLCLANGLALAHDARLVGVVGKFRTIVAAVAGCVVCRVWAGPMVQPDFWSGCRGYIQCTFRNTFRNTIIAAIAGFCLCCALADAPAVPTAYMHDPPIPEIGYGAIG